MEKPKKKYLIGIAGNIGVGKTTLTTNLGKRLGWHSYYESVIDNPFLDDFYGDMKRWSFNLQIYFLAHRFRSQKEKLLIQVNLRFRIEPFMRMWKSLPAPFMSRVICLTEITAPIVICSMT